MLAVEDSVQEGGTNEVMKERRASPRFSPSEVKALQSAKLVDGPEARLINVSRGGVLLETAEPMSLGGIVYVRLVAADAIFLLRGRVTRSHQSLLRSANPLYESAILFDGEVPLPVEAKSSSLAAEKPAAVLPLAAEPGQGKSEVKPATPEVQQSGACAVTAAVSRLGPDLHQIFGLNNW
jgi:hypothetical protein